MTSSGFVDAVAARRGGAPRSAAGPARGVRFAFYGRMSTRGFQDPATSRSWQRAVSEELIEGVGEIVVDFFDEDRSRRWSWQDRPAASALLAAAEDRDRGFDAVVVGEYERAFYGDQFREVVARLNELGVQLWLPEAGGPVELDSPVHEALMVLLGAQAQREVVRTRHRVKAAMGGQTRLEGRFLGGRPPFGYRLADAGPHPNVTHAQWGRRVHVLEPDPETAPWVRWLFAERARGRSVASLARELNDRGVPCPSDADQARNSHQPGGRWIARTIRLILENPRYTGRQVWNRHATKGHGAGGRADGRGSGAVRRNSVQEWEVSEQRAHTPLVDEATFIAVQRIRVARPTKDGQTREYALAGLVVCGECGRRMDAHWVHGRAGYRCRHGYKAALPRPSPVPRTVYVREDQLRDALPGLLSQHGGEPPGQDVGNDVGDYLRRAGLEIVCSHAGWGLRPIPGCPAPELVASPGQMPSVLETDPTVERQKENPATSSKEC
ncbi:recombinase family protein [Saccharopolyspora sp. WRP15-2]|uniref:Recombinase family protein n=1 Tax=Saccharopolyspora oryzae TaxID=2997343 RepID=A0ABT4UVS4_9PSEU|nr:recombinase family protein [Saccharopolyspora oryzae]MDA3625653.1 recombinase family protein [Saccharopolyspora oryzae]